MSQVSERVRRVIDNAEAAYERCWVILAGIKRGTAGLAIGEFQPTLAETLLALSREYRFVSQVRKQLIREKGKSHPQRFISRQRILGKRLQNLAQTIAIGRGLGDSFAWFFYQFDRDYLLKHAEEPENALLPPGIGGQGEVEFIKRTQFVGRFLVLYHGITTLLRLGDVSLVDLARFRVAAIGELKTQKREAPGEIRVTLIFKGSRKRIKAGRLSKTGTLQHDLPPLLKGRLERQLKRIGSALQGGEGRKIGAQLGGIASGYVPALARLVRSAKRSRFADARAGPGLWLTGYRAGTRSLYGRLNHKPTASGLPERMSTVSGLVLPGSLYNRLLLGVLHYGGKGFGPRLLVGTIPLFWWGLEIEELKPLMLSEMVAMTLYNPAHLAARLEDAGFDVSQDSSAAGFSVQRSRDGGFVAVEHLDYFLSLIRFCLFSEAQVTEIITKGIDAVERQGLLKHGNRITWQFNHLLLRPSWRARRG